MRFNKARNVGLKLDFSPISIGRRGIGVKRGLIRLRKNEVDSVKKKTVSLGRPQKPVSREKKPKAINLSRKLDKVVSLKKKTLETFKKPDYKEPKKVEKPLVTQTADKTIERLTEDLNSMYEQSLSTSGSSNYPISSNASVFGSDKNLGTYIMAFAAFILFMIMNR